MRIAKISTVVLVAVVVAAVGCSSEDDDPKVGNGVNDVRIACDLRSQWVRTANDCSLCEAGVITERCDCVSLKDFSAACIDQQNARKAACPETVDQCVFKCQRTDCDCIDACYANDARCKQAAAARDGCITEACKDRCK